MNEGRVVVDNTVEDLLAGFETRGYRITARGGSDAALADLQDRFDLTDVQDASDRPRFEVDAETVTFYRLTDAMEAHGLNVASVETVRPDLTEVFVEMTNGTANPDGASVGSSIQPNTSSRAPSDSPVATT